MNIKLTKETRISITGETLYRIKAIKDIPSKGVKKEDKGGFISTLEVSGNARVSDDAWVSDDAQVYGSARVSGNAWVYGCARVHGYARVSDNAQMFGNARVSDDARVSGNSWVYGNAQVYGDAWVSGNAWVFGNAQVYGDAQMYGNAWVYGDAWVYGNAQVYGDAKVSGNARMSSLNHIFNAIICSKFSITITPQNTVIGCHLKTRKEWFKVTKKDAIKMGLPKEMYEPYKQIIKAGMKLVPEEKETKK